ncbi:MAG: cytochrome P450 [Chloroflexi bacterium]|nr:cytochrome P450 [Chloroflexota bacterium]
MRQIPLLKLNQLQRHYGPDFILHVQQSYGDLFTAKVPFLPRIHVALHPNHAYELLVKQAHKLEKPAFIRRTIQSSFGDGLFTSSGDLWRKQRKLMQPAFHHGRIARYAERMVQHTVNLLSQWQTGQVLAIDEAMHALTFTIVVDAMFSADASTQTAHINQAMHDLGQGLTAQSLSFLAMMLPDWAPHPALRQKRRGANGLKQVVTAMMQARRIQGEEVSPSDLLSTLMFTRDADTGERMSDQQVQDELVTLFIAGHETTAVLLDWAWVLLAQNPEVAARLQEELREVLRGRIPTFSDLPALPYTETIVKEVLRLYPPAWFIFRQATEPVELEGATFPAKTLFFLFPYAAQRDSRWYDQPQQFNPDRWRNGLEQTLSKGAYFPFGLGPRICIGNGFAQMEAQLLLATIAQRFHLEILDQPQITPGSPTLSFAHPVRVRLHSHQTGV